MNENEKYQIDKFIKRNNDFIISYNDIFETFLNTTLKYCKLKNMSFNCFDNKTHEKSLIDLHIIINMNTILNNNENYYNVLKNNILKSLLDINENIYFVKIFKDHMFNLIIVYRKIKTNNIKMEQEQNKQNFQQCAHLEVNNDFKELKEKGQDTLETIFNMQKSIQEKVYGYDFDKIRSTIGELKKFIDWNEEAIRDEDREMQAALTGIHTYPNCWKPWKTKHAEAMNRPFSELREDELKELQMEWIDKLHFFINVGIAINLTPELITNYYISKNKENVRRQNQGGY